MKLPRRHFPLLPGIVLALLLSLGFSGTAFASSFFVPPRAAPAAPPCSYCYNDLFYGADQSIMDLAWSNTGPQKRDYWCGVESIVLINWYDQIKTFGYSVQPLWNTQESVGNDTRGHLSPVQWYPPDSSNGLLNTANSTSPWGKASTTSYGPAFIADIAGDTGTDPRSIAWGLYTVSPNNFYFHNWIYHTDNLTATYDFASDYGSAHGINHPISVAINQGAHSFVIDGVYATGDPSAGGEVVDAIDTWDPSKGSPWGAYNKDNQQQLWSLYDWLNKQFNDYSYLWAQPYSRTANSGYDPEPSTIGSNYYNAPTQYVPFHWDGRYVTIEEDRVTRCHGSPDIAYDENGNEVPHNGTAYCP